MTCIDLSWNETTGSLCGGKVFEFANCVSKVQLFFNTTNFLMY